MELTDAQYERIAPLLPKPRGTLTTPGRQVLNALLYRAEHGCSWRGLPDRFGHWHRIYKRLDRWSKSGVLAQVLAELQQELAPELYRRALSLGSLDIGPTAGAEARRMARGPRSTTPEHYFSMRQYLSMRQAPRSTAG